MLALVHRPGRGATDVARPARNLSAGFDNQRRLLSSVLCFSVSRFILSLVAAGSFPGKKGRQKENKPGVGRGFLRAEHHRRILITVR